MQGDITHQAHLRCDGEEGWRVPAHSSPLGQPWEAAGNKEAIWGREERKEADSATRGQRLG